MNRIKAVLLVMTLFSTGLLMAQEGKRKTEPAVDSSLLADYDFLFSELDAFLDSLLTPRTYTLVSAGGGMGSYNYSVPGTTKTEVRRQLTLTPSLGYFHKSGLGLSVTGAVLYGDRRFNAYQANASASYDYLRNMDWAAGA
ncbi:MAG TPA: hypothetical protein VHK69_21600, partial [Chitinophagaceae bacterium]|nr:hypothetical protein [Chitinophagaceae bacterium]